MSGKRSAIRGCLLGLAVGDAMGYTVDTKTWPQIQEDYGPHGLMGYDLCNGYADVTSHTQIGVFTCNGLLLGLTRGQVLGKIAPYVKYAALALREWAAGQRRYDQPRNIYCWAFRVPELRRRHCVDTRVLDILNRERLGSMEDPINRSDSPVSLSAAVAAALFAQPERISREEAERLGAECVALTTGSPMAFLAGAYVTSLLVSCLQDRDTPLRELVLTAADTIENRFRREYTEAAVLCGRVRRAAFLAEERNMAQVAAMEELTDNSCAGALAGAVYAALLCEEDFDSAMIVAVNHSGPSAAVGMLTGAILGARLGEEALPDFYLEGLEIATVLRELAGDLYSGCPMTRGNKLYDADWDRKYLHGEY